MNFQQELVALLQTVILGILNIGAGYLVYYVKQISDNAKIKNQKNKNEEQKILIDNTIDRLDTLINKSVVATNETLAKAIKEGLADGKTNREELLALKDVVIRDVKNQLSQDSQDLISIEIKDIDSYISNSIEVALKNIKELN